MQIKVCTPFSTTIVSRQSFFNVFLEHLQQVTLSNTADVQRLNRREQNPQTAKGNQFQKLLFCSFNLVWQLVHEGFIVIFAKIFSATNMFSVLAYSRHANSYLCFHFSTRIFDPCNMFCFFPTYIFRLSAPPPVTQSTVLPNKAVSGLSATICTKMD